MKWPTVEIDRLEFRIGNALDRRPADSDRTGSRTASAQGLSRGLRPAWQTTLAPPPPPSMPRRRTPRRPASASPACGMAAATPRCPIHRPSASA